MYVGYNMFEVISMNPILGIVIIVSGAVSIITTIAIYIINAFFPELRGIL